MARRLWSRDELIAAFNLYCKLPFGQMHRGNSAIIELATALGRTPSAIAMKLVNFAAFDPAHQRRGVTGLRNTSRADEAIWHEFNGNWAELAAESERALRDRLRAANIPVPTAEDHEGSPEYLGETEGLRTQKERLGQSFFREVVLSGYGKHCCICDLPDHRLLVASHIVPWAHRKDIRVNPRNGLCLCALHDRAFDRGLIAVEADLTLLVSSQFTPLLPQPIVEAMFIAFRGRPVRQPDKFALLAEFLRYHRENIFKSA